MAMGTRKQREKQEDLWIANAELASAPGHPFYQRLNELLETERFDELVEVRYAKFYAARYGRRSLTPGIYFRSLLVGYFEGSTVSVGLPGGWRTRWRCGALATPEYHQRVRIFFSNRTALRAVVEPKRRTDGASW
jgi:hypothetical protein